MPGASGSGKSTFLNVLCGKAFYGKQSGSVSVRIQEVNQATTAPSVAAIKNIRGFVPQDDIVHEDLTVLLAGGAFTQSWSFLLLSTTI